MNGLEFKVGKHKIGKKEKVREMKEVKDVCWFIFGGAIWFAFWGLLGLILCATVVGIPLGKQLFKAAKFSLNPFDETVEVETNFARNFVANIIWLPIGLIVITLYALLGAALSITLVGAPLGKGYFKLLMVAMAPFGIEVDEKHEVIKEWEEWKNW